jgi:LacI family transcriptional regulator
MSKVTMQDIADELGISRVTVWKVFNNHSGVSEAVRESVLQKAKELGYSKFMQEPAAIPNDPQEDKTVSLIVSRPDSSTFWTNIIHRLAQELATHNINLLYTYVPSSYTPSYSFPSALTNGTVSGAIILNVYDTKMVELINNTLNIPKVFLDTVPEVGNRALHGDLLLIEGYNTMYEIKKPAVKFFQMKLLRQAKLPLGSTLPNLMYLSGSVMASVATVPFWSTKICPLASRFISRSE